MGPRTVGIGAILALLAAGATAYWWWARPERQIGAILDDVAGALTYEAGTSGLEPLAAVATLERHLADEVSVQAGGAPTIEGRDAVISAGARLRARTPAMRVRFLDTRITFADDRTATPVATAEAAMTTVAGAQRLEVHQVLATVTRSADRWVVSNARASSISEPSP
jgi:hypothetical protein